MDSSLVMLGGTALGCAATVYGVLRHGQRDELPRARSLTRLEHRKREYVRSAIEPWTVEGQEEIAQLEVDVLALIESGDEDLPWRAPPSPYGVSMAQMTQALNALATGGTRIREGALSAQQTPIEPPAQPSLVPMDRPRIPVTGAEQYPHREIWLARGDGSRTQLACGCDECRARVLSRPKPDKLTTVRR